MHTIDATVGCAVKTGVSEAVFRREVRSEVDEKLHEVDVVDLSCDVQQRLPAARHNIEKVASQLEDALDLLLAIRFAKCSPASATTFTTIYLL